jgi:hypothetical protein
MKSAYELAMERLQKQAPSLKLTDEQKAQLAELESLYRSRLAEREIGLRDSISQAATEGNMDEVMKLEQQLAIEKQKIAEELEARKEAVRQPKKK